MGCTVQFATTHYFIGIFFSTLPHVIVSSCVSIGYIPFRGPLLVDSCDRDLALSASLLVLGSPVLGSATCYSSVFECSVWHSSDPRLLLELGPPVLESAGCARC